MKTFLSVAAFAFFTSLVSGSCPEGYTEFSGRCYSLLAGNHSVWSMPWECPRQNATRANVHDVFVNNFILSLENDTTSGLTCIWLGLTYNKTAGGFTWDDGTKLDGSFTHWSKGYPKSASGSPYVYTSTDAKTRGEWINVGKSKTPSCGLVCESVAPAGPDVTQVPAFSTFGPRPPYQTTGYPKYPTIHPKTASYPHPETVTYPRPETVTFHRPETTAVPHPEQPTYAPLTDPPYTVGPVVNGTVGPTTPVCPTSDYLGKGTITSPNFPLPYFNDLTCTYTIRASGGEGARVLLQFGEIETDRCCDLIFVYDGFATGAPTRVLSGSYKAGEEHFLSTSNVLTVVFESDPVVNAAGWEATFMTVF